MGRFKLILGLRLTTFAMMLIALPFAATAQESAPKPILLMLMTQVPEILDVEEGLSAELSISLESHTLRTMAFSFLTNTVAGRNEEIRTAAAAYRADAVIWIEQLSPNTVSLQLVAVAPGRSTTRTIEAPLDENTGGDLAIATRELLNSVRISLKPPDNISNHAAPPPRSPTTPSEEKVSVSAENTGLVRLLIGFDISGGFEHPDQTPLLLGGAVGVTIGKRYGVFVDIAVAAFGGVSPTTISGELSTFGVRPEVGVGYLWNIKKVYLGPYLGLQAPWQRAVFHLNSSDTRDAWWNFRVVPSLDLRVRLHRRVKLLFRFGAGFHALQERFEQGGSGETLYISPYVDWNAAAGIILSFRKKR